MAHPLLEKEGDYSQLVLFDIDETTLSNLQLYRETDYFPNSEQRHEWYDQGAAVAIPAALKFYRVKSDGY